MKQIILVFHILEIYVRVKLPDNNTVISCS